MTAPVATTEPMTDPAASASESEIVFPNGLVGQPDWRRFVLLTPESDATIQVLQSMDDAGIALMVTNPRQIISGYKVPLSSDDRALLDLGADEQPVLMCTLSIHNELVTANLVGPLVINRRSRIGTQLVIVDSPYSTRHPLTQLGEHE